MPSIDVDFEVFKALTNLRPTEDVTNNDVLRELLNLSPAAKKSAAGLDGKGSCVIKGVVLPNGTELMATYKGQTYRAEIKDGRWISSNGEFRKSPSEAANKITRTSVNGWDFWKAKRPGDPSWRVLSELR